MAPYPYDHCYGLATCHAIVPESGDLRHFVKNFPFAILPTPCSTADMLEDKPRCKHAPGFATHFRLIPV